MPTAGPNAHSQENNELAEMRAMFKEMKALMERNFAFMERFAEQSHVDRLNTQYLQRHPEGEFDNQPDLDMVSHEQVVMAEEVAMAPAYDEILVFTELQEFQWETENDMEHVDEEFLDSSTPETNE